MQNRPNNRPAREARPASHYIHHRRSAEDGRHRHAFHRRIAYDAAHRWEHRLALLREHPTGEARLWATVLDEAIKDLTWGWAPHHTEGSRGTVVRATVAWFTADDDRTAGAFAWICRELDLPAPQVRDDVMADAHLGEELH